MAERLFGTDGVRASPAMSLTAELAVALGRAAATACDSPSGRRS